MRGMRFIFVIMVLCILAGILCVIFAVSENIKEKKCDAYILEKNEIAR